MRNPLLLIGTLGLIIVPSVTTAHPPVFDPHNGCPVANGGPGLPLPPVILVRGTLSYIQSTPPPGDLSLHCEGITGSLTEWGSHASGCPALPGIVAVNGVFCGPLVPAGGTVTCTWFPLQSTLLTGLVIGFDRGLIFPLANGFIRVADGESPVLGPFIALTFLSVEVTNPFHMETRVMAFPTNVGGTTLAPGDLHLIWCSPP